LDDEEIEVRERFVKAKQNCGSGKMKLLCRMRMTSFSAPESKTTHGINTRSKSVFQTQRKKKGEKGS
jgi:hypothetical protein